MTDKPGPGGLDVLDPVVDTWDEAIASVRNSAKWLVVVVATVATFLFGAGTLGARSELGDAPVPLLLLAALLGVVGIAALAEVAWRVADVFRPEVVSVDELTDETRTALRTSWWLAFRDEPPTDRPPETELVARLKRYRADLGQLDAALLDQQQAPGTEGASTRAALGRARDTLVEQQRQAHQLTATVMEMERYHRVKATRSLTPRTYVTAGVALASALLFQLTLAAATGAEEEDGSAPSGGASPVVGWLSPTEDGADFWEAVGLTSCRPPTGAETAPDQPAGGIPVLLTEGEGTADTPYVVQTLSELGSDCPSVSFPADERFTLVQPVPRTVEIADPTTTD